VPHDDSNPGRADPVPPLVCLRTHGAVDVGWVRIAGALDSGTAARLERTPLVVLDLRDLHLVAPPVHTYLPPAGGDCGA
jgi:hypothetical protein